MADESKETPQNVVVAQASGSPQEAEGGRIFTDVYSRWRDGSITREIEIEYGNGSTGTKEVRPVLPEDIERLNFDWENHTVSTKITGP